jgi:hypothetical protein
MTSPQQFVSVAATLLLMAAVGCADHRRRRECCEAPIPLGTLSDPFWQKQEANAEASDFVVHDHEFIRNTNRLNDAGEQHVKQIAARADETPFPVIVEPSSMTRNDADKYGFPIHGNPDLDLHRREIIVRALTEMGVREADKRVVVSPALTPGFQQFEAERAYYNGFGTRGNSGFGGFGGAGGGFGGGFGGF